VNAGTKSRPGVKPGGFFFRRGDMQGYFQTGRFITDAHVQIPERKKVIVTVPDEDIDEAQERKAYQTLWDEIIDEIENSSEALVGEPGVRQVIEE
jgi:hypothetical protein